MITNWQINSVGDCWRIGSQFIKIGAYEDCEDHTVTEKENGKCDCQEVWVGDDKNGNWNEEGIFDSWKDAINYVIKFMKNNPNGWLNVIKPKQDDKEKVNFT